MRLSEGMIEAVLDGHHPADIVDDLLEAEPKYKGKKVPKEIKQKLLVKMTKRAEGAGGDTRNPKLVQKYRARANYLNALRQIKGQPTPYASRGHVKPSGPEEGRVGKQKSIYGPEYRAPGSTRDDPYYTRPGLEKGEKEGHVRFLRLWKTMKRSRKAGK